MKSVPKPKTGGRKWKDTMIKLDLASGYFGHMPVRMDMIKNMTMLVVGNGRQHTEPHI